MPTLLLCFHPTVAKTRIFTYAFVPHLFDVVDRVKLPVQSLIPRVTIACVFPVVTWELVTIGLLVFIFHVFTRYEARLRVALGNDR